MANRRAHAIWCGLSPIRIEVDVFLKELGWSEGRPAQIDTGVGDQGGQNEMRTLNASFSS